MIKKDSKKTGVVFGKRKQEEIERRSFLVFDTGGGASEGVGSCGSFWVCMELPLIFWVHEKQC